MFLYYFAIPAVVIVVVLILLVLFEPGLDYAVTRRRTRSDSDEFLCLLGALADAQVHRDSRVEGADQRRRRSTKRSSRRSAAPSGASTSKRTSSARTRSAGGSSRRWPSGRGPA